MITLITNKKDSFSLEMMDLYFFYSNLIINECSAKGLGVLNWFQIKKMRLVKKTSLSKRSNSSIDPDSGWEAESGRDIQIHAEADINFGGVQERHSAGQRRGGDFAVREHNPAVQRVVAVGREQDFPAAVRQHAADDHLGLQQLPGPPPELLRVPEIGDQPRLRRYAFRLFIILVLFSIPMD